jgi:hypothetical protein
MQKNTTTYSLADEIRKLEQLRQEDILSQADFERAKENLLEGVRGNQEMQNRLAKVEVQNRLMEIDQEWELERQKHMVQGKHGLYEPTMDRTIAGSVIMIIFGLASFGMFASLSNSPIHFVAEPMMTILILIGIVSLIGAVGIFISGMNQSTNYQIAKSDYEKKRSDIQKIQKELE